MQLLGHKEHLMTLRYVQVTLQDLQREFHAARRSTHRTIPAIQCPSTQR